MTFLRLVDCGSTGDLVLRRLVDPLPNRDEVRTTPVLLDQGRRLPGVLGSSNSHLPDGLTYDRGVGTEHVDLDDLAGLLDHPHRLIGLLDAIGQVLPGRADLHDHALVRAGRTLAHVPSSRPGVGDLNYGDVRAGARPPPSRAVWPRVVPEATLEDGARGVDSDGLQTTGEVRRNRRITCGGARARASGRR